MLSELAVRARRALRVAKRVARGDRSGHPGDLLVSGFNELPPAYPGGIWRVRRRRIEPLYRGYGIFGLAWSDHLGLALGATRVADVPLLAFRPDERGRYRPIPIEYENWIAPFRTHGIAVHRDRLYLVATQGDPDAVICTNEDWAGHRVGKVIISTLELRGERLVVRDGRVWNPYGCAHHHHYNDLLVNDESIFVVSFSVCHAGGYVERGAVSRFGHDLGEPRIVVDGLRAPHSALMHEGRMYLCSSGASSIVSSALGADSMDTFLHFKGPDNFVRGLVVTREHFILGLSRSASRSNSEHLTDSMNGLLEIDRRDGSARRIEMPADVDNTYSILAIPGNGHGA